jgi:UDP-glucose 4-epimerase
MSVVVTGANGFVGIHTVRRLLDEGYNVSAVDISDSRMQSEFGSNKHCTITRGDIVAQDMRRIIEKDTKVLHLAAVPKFAEAREDPQKAVRVNIEGTLNIMQACIEKKAERLVYSSTGSVYSPSVPVPIREDAAREPTSVYGLTKKQAEDWIFFYGNRLPYIILRYAYVYGKGKDWGAVGAFLQRIKEGRQPAVYGGKQTNDFIYIRDIVQANLLALETDRTRQVYNIGTGRATSIKDVCELCLKAAATDLKMKIEPAREFDFPVFVYDISKAQTLLGFDPKWNISDGVEDILK